MPKRKSSGDRAAKKFLTYLLGFTFVWNLKQGLSVSLSSSGESGRAGDA